MVRKQHLNLDPCISLLNPIQTHLRFVFSLNYKRGAVMAVAWDNGTITFVTHTFLTDAELKSRII